MKGFHNSFKTYCDWYDQQEKLNLPTMNWGDWWEHIADKGQ